MANINTHIKVNAPSKQDNSKQPNADTQQAVIEAREIVKARFDRSKDKFKSCEK